MIPETYFNSIDRLNQANYGVSQSKIEDYRVEYARVHTYYPLTNTADVILFRGGSGSPINVKVGVHYQGPNPGTGEVFAVHKGQLVKVEFAGGSATGLFNQGTIVGTVYTHQDNHAPAYAPWLQSGNGSAVVYPKEGGGWGNAEHIDEKSNVSRTTVARTNVEDWGNYHEVVNGPSTTRSEELTGRAATGFQAASDAL